MPAFEVDVVDTTGCGDAFSAGFLAGVTSGRTPREAAEAARSQAQSPFSAASWVRSGLGLPPPGFSPCDAFAAPLVNSLPSGWS